MNHRFIEKEIANFDQHKFSDPRPGLSFIPRESLNHPGSDLRPCWFKGPAGFFGNITNLVITEVMATPEFLGGFDDGL